MSCDACQDRGLIPCQGAGCRNGWVPEKSNPPFGPVYICSVCRGAGLIPCPRVGQGSERMMEIVVNAQGIRSKTLSYFHKGRCPACAGSGRIDCLFCGTGSGCLGLIIHPRCQMPRCDHRGTRGPGRQSCPLIGLEGIDHDK